MREYHKQLDKRMFDFHQFYWDMATKLPTGAVIAEVGVAEGASAIFLAETLLNLKKTFTFYFIDNLAYGQDLQLRHLMKNVGNAGIGHLVEIIPLSSVEAACRFPDNHFDFVFIDASHKTEETKADILLWYEKTKSGGVLAGHDYNKGEGIEVHYAVNMMIPKFMRNSEGEGAVRALQVIQTEQGHNVWKIRKQDNLKIQTH